ncbi:MAG: Jag N-terminal domain-containing protein [Oscillibacter sp.]|nr:Jag N-terminal domain-containing protein [Oscillibacter sp.]
MRDYIEIAGKTEEEAIRKGLEQLGLDRDEVSIEILERAKAGFLGFGSAPAKIRVSYGPDKPDPVPEPAEADKPQSKAAKPEKKADKPQSKEPDTEAEGAGTETPAPERRERRERRRKPKAPAPEIPDDAPDAVPVIAPAPQPDAAKKARPGKGKRKPSAKAPDPPQAEPVPVPAEEVDDEKAQAIRAFLSGLLEHMDCQAEIRVFRPEESRYKVILEGAGMGALIGRRGETLDAIQQLTNYSVNRNGARVRIQLDAEGYREKREQSLQNLARKEAAKVVKYRRSRTLEPMNAYERHVIHTALQEFPGVNTYSTGVDPNRRVVIAFDRENA